MTIHHATILGTRAAVLLSLALGAASTASAQYAPAPVAPNSTANTVNAVTSLVTGQPAPTTGYYYPNTAYPAGTTYPGYAPATTTPYATAPGYAPRYPAGTYYQSGYSGYVQPQATYPGQQQSMYQQQTYPYSQPMTGNRYVDAARTLIQPQYQTAPTGYYYQQPGIQNVIPRR
ncbi:hypothetical protein [Paludisphaera rhizosphaerae]|uniref:hypothetical protein n=1 Tax=Paludisphaera rhizosphaerae TaxID=2711216 RepID=UPI0013EA6F93|nr:hypothetical protein [Paludisphaera rhizosphaerae]